MKSIAMVAGFLSMLAGFLVGVGCIVDILVHGTDNTYFMVLACWFLLVAICLFFVGAQRYD